MPLAVVLGQRNCVPASRSVVCRSSIPGAVMSRGVPGATGSASRTTPAPSAFRTRPPMLNVTPATGAPVSPLRIVNADPAGRRGSGVVVGVGALGRLPPPPQAPTATPRTATGTLRREIGTMGPEEANNPPDRRQTAGLGRGGRRGL